jgi:hypothetical protein
MENNKIHERVLEIKSQIETASPEQQVKMINELINLTAQLEQSLSEEKITINEN